MMKIVVSNVIHYIKLQNVDSDTDIKSQFRALLTATEQITGKMAVQ